MNTTDTLPPEDMNRIFRGLRELDAQCADDNKNDRADTLISACIINSINTGSRVRGALRTLGFNPDHVAIRLKKGTGSNPAYYRWKRDSGGIYSEHGEAAAPRVSPADIIL